MRNEATSQFRWREVPRSSGGQLDRQGQAVEAPANGLHRGGVRIGEAEIWPGRLGATDEEPHRRGQAGPLGGGCMSGRGQRQGRNGEGMLPRDAKHRTAGDQTHQVRAPREEFGQKRRCLDDVLEVVEDEQGILPLQEVRDPLQERSMAGLTHVQRLRDRREDQGGVTDGGQRHEPDPIGKVPRGLLGDPQGEPGLADPTGSGEGQEADVVSLQQVAQGRHLALTTDERGERRGEGRGSGGRGCAGHGLAAPPRGGS